MNRFSTPIPSPPAKHRLPTEPAPNGICKPDEGAGLPRAGSERLAALQVAPTLARVPHLRLEYSGNLAAPADFQPLFAELHRILHEEGGIGLHNCKSRAVKLDHFRVGNGAADDAFVHLTVRVLDGRTDAVQRRIGELALRCLERHFGAGSDAQQITVEVGAIPRALYFKSPAGTI